MVLARRPFKIEQLLTNVRTIFSAQAQARCIQLSFLPLPSSLAELSLIGDVRRLQQALSNGVSNALKFTEAEGKVEISVTESAHTREGWHRVHIRVTDSGLGLDQVELEKLRKGDVFTQVGRGQLQGNGGTGLGLNIARHILQLHNNSALSLYSVGHMKGTCFEIQLSLPEEGHDDHSANPTPHVPSRLRHDQPSVPQQRLQPARNTRVVSVTPLRELACLHVEDDMLLQLTIGARILKLGVPVEIAGNGQLAVKMVAARKAQGLEPYSIVIMDNQMPIMGGGDATRAIRQAGFDGTIIGMTGDPLGSSDRTEFEQSGLDDCVDKTPEGLATIEEVIKEQVLRLQGAART